jgi:hypothetical protein
MPHPSRILKLLVGAIACLALSATPALARPIDMPPPAHKVARVVHHRHHVPPTANMPHWPAHPQLLARPASVHHHGKGGSPVPVIPIVAAAAGLVALGGVFVARARPRAARAGAHA